MHDDGKQKKVKKLTRIKGRKPLMMGYPDFLTCFAKGRERPLLKEVELLWLALLSIFEDLQGVKSSIQQ